MGDDLTPQEEFWSGKFGDEYIARNQSAQVISANIHFFARALQVAGPIASVVELGANVGLNLQALRTLYPEAHLRGIEINALAASRLREHADAVDECSVLQWEPIKADLALIKTVLIHINPGKLPQAYDRLYRASRRYILLAEYFNPTPVEVAYRGHTEMLFKRDFAGEILDCYPDLRLIDYGFCYKRATFSQDNITWFLLEKS